MNENELVGAGYNRCPPEQTYARTNGLVCFWQKRFQDVKGVKYFLNIEEHDIKSVVPSYPSKEHLFQACFQGEPKDSSGEVYNFEFNCKGMSIERVEEIVEKFFNNMNIKYEESYEDDYEQAPTGMAP